MKTVLSTPLAHNLAWDESFKRRKHHGGGGGGGFSGGLYDSEGFQLLDKEGYYLLSAD